MLEVKSILMVCQGNICRSPMAEGFFTYQLNKIHSPISITSAGIGAVIDCPADPHARDVMAQHGIDISGHRAHQATEDLIRRKDLILVMTRSHLSVLTKQFPVAKGKTFLLMHWSDEEIPDPFMQSKSAFNEVYQQIQLAWQNWGKRIVLCQI